MLQDLQTRRQQRKEEVKCLLIFESAVYFEESKTGQDGSQDGWRLLIMALVYN